MHGDVAGDQAAFATYNYNPLYQYKELAADNVIRRDLVPRYGEEGTFHNHRQFRTTSYNYDVDSNIGEDEQIISYSNSYEQCNVFDIEDFYLRLESEAAALVAAQDMPRLVGSPFVQSRYVRNQIHGMLRRHLIDSDRQVYRSEAAQLRTLFENALQFAVTSNTVFGTPLSIESDKSSVDMIWPERRVINGETVVVPIVYLSPATIASRTDTDHRVEFNGNVSFDSVDITGVEIIRDTFNLFYSYCQFD